MTKTSDASVHALNKRARNQLNMLTAQLLLGMAVNLIGLPSETNGASKAATSIFLGLHMLIGLGLLVGAGMTIRRAAKTTPGQFKLARAGAILVVVTFLAGIATMATKNNWWSYAMAVGFMASFWVYGILYVQSRTEKSAASKTA